LIAELSASQPDMLKRMRGSLPVMYDKAYRWVAEMQEIADFHEANPAARDIYAAIARLYEHLAAAEAETPPAAANAVTTLERVLGRGPREA
jgi:hypothetical protein